MHLQKHGIDHRIRHALHIEHHRALHSIEPLGPLHSIELHGGELSQGQSKTSPSAFIRVFRFGAAFWLGLFLLGMSGCFLEPEVDPEPPVPTWVEERPFPEVQALTGVHVYHDELAFAVGSDGTILRFSGEEIGWTQEEPLTDVLLTDIHGRYWSDQDEDLTFVVGEGGTILKHTPDGWTQLNSPVTTRLNGVWVRNRQDAYFVGDEGKVLRWTGPELDEIIEMSAELRQERMVPRIENNVPVVDGNGDPVLEVEYFWRRESLKSIAGNSVNNILAVGANGFVFHFSEEDWVADARPWTVEDSNSSRPFQRLFIGGGGTWVTATDGILLRRRDVEGELGWFEDYQVPLSVTLKDIYSLGGNDVFVVGFAGSIFHFHDGDWEEVKLREDAQHLRSIHGVVTADATDLAPRQRLVIAVGGGGRIIRGPEVLPPPVVDGGVQ